MKTASTDLFELIKSLSNNEKHHFRKHCNETKHKNLSYIKLFNVIDKTKNYDELQIINTLGYNNKLKAFSVLKNYLYSEVMDVVSKITDSDEHKPDAINQLQQLNFLANKGLFDQYTKLWNKSYEDAREKELFQVQFLLRNQLQHLKINFYLKTNEVELKKIIEEDEAFNNEYESLQRIRNLFRTIQLYNKQSQIRLLDSEIKDIKELQKNPLLTKLPKNSSFHYSYYYHFSLALILYLTHDYSKALHHLEEIKKNILKNNKLILSNPHLNIEFVSVYYVVAFLLKEYKSFFNYIKQPFIEKFESKQHKAFIFAYWANSNIRFLITNGQYDKAKEFITDIENRIDQFIEDIPIEIKQNLLCSIGISNFILGNYNEAFYRLKNCLNTFQIYPRQDIQRSVYCLCILVAFELKNMRLLNNECDIAYHFFYRKKIATKFELTLISFFRKLAKSTYGRLELKDKFAQLRTELDPIKKDPILAQLFRYFNFYGWAESKEQGINYMDYVKKQQS